MFTVSIDTESVRKGMINLEEEIDEGTSNGLNDAAFALRQLWIEDITNQVDNPVNFTKKVFVKKSQKNTLEAKTYLPPQQSAYLQKIVGGGTRKPGDVATLRGTVLVPVGAKLNASGNFPGGPKRWIATVEDKIKGAFVLPLRGAAKRGGVFQRFKGKLKLLAIFEDDTQYKPTLLLDETVSKFAPEAQKIISDRIQDKFR